MPVRRLATVRADDAARVGGKAASLGELTAAGLPVPPGFVVTADSYRSFLERAGIEDELAAAVDVDADDPDALADAAERAQALVRDAPFPDDLREEILGAYDELTPEDSGSAGASADDADEAADDADEAADQRGEPADPAAADDGPPVAVRSSATAEDQPDASFAGQQDTYLNVTGEALLDRVRDCWASLFTQRALYYRQQQDYPAADVDIAVVVQRMADADRSGVLFTSDPSTGEPRTVVEAAWGLGEAVVAGEVSPDNYVLEESGDVAEVAVADKAIQYVRDPESGETVEEPVPEADRTRRVLDEGELARLRELGERAAEHYGSPQDVEWAIVDDPDAASALARDGSTTAGDDSSTAGNDSSSAADESPSTIADESSSEPAAEHGLEDATAFVLQSRPITTIDDADAAAADAGATGDDRPRDDASDGSPASDADGEPVASAAASAADGSGAQVAGDRVVVQGLAASPGEAGGPARIVERLDEIDQVREGDVLVAEMTTPDMVPAMERATAIVTDRGGMTSHASIVSRELGVPAVVGTESATTAIENGAPITVDGETGRVTEGAEESAANGTAATSSNSSHGANAAGTARTAPDAPTAGAGPSAPEQSSTAPTKPATATEVKVNLSIPEAAERAAATGADGVGLVRVEHVVLSTGETPAHYIAEHGREAFVDELVDAIRGVADAFYPRPVRVRTLDAPTDEFRELEGGGDEPVEHNPMLGFRGVRRSLAEPEPFRAQLAAIAKCHDLGYDNVETMLPLVTDAEDVRAAREHLAAAGLDPRTHTWGVMVETPASALCVEGMLDQPIDFVSFGTNDLTQYALAVDRNNERVADRFDELHPAVLELIADVIETCRERGVATSICGQAGSRPEMVRHLVDCGISSISANVDAVRDVQQQVERVEQRMLLESVRERGDD